MRSEATTAEEYLASLPEDRREAIAAIREAILAGLPDGYEEGIEFGMLSWHVPLARYPDTYNGAPLSYVALASQKNYMSLYLMGIYGDKGNRSWFEAAAAKRGAKLDIGKSCVRFRRLGDLPLDLVTEAVGRIGVDEYIGIYEASRTRK
jgi:Domain of unknown function (DU1801)